MFQDGLPVLQNPESRSFEMGRRPPVSLLSTRLPSVWQTTCRHAQRAVAFLTLRWFPPPGPSPGIRRSFPPQEPASSASGFLPPEPELGDLQLSPSEGLPFKGARIALRSISNQGLAVLAECSKGCPPIDGTALVVGIVSPFGVRQA